MANTYYCETCKDLVEVKFEDRGISQDDAPPVPVCINCGKVNWECMACINGVGKYCKKRRVK